MEENEQILYDLIVHEEWKQEPQLLVSLSELGIQCLSFILEILHFGLKRDNHTALL